MSIKSKQHGWYQRFTQTSWEKSHSPVWQGNWIRGLTSAEMEAPRGNIICQSYVAGAGVEGHRFNPGTWRGAWQPTLVFLLGESQEQRSLADCSPRGCEESTATGATEHAHTHLDANPSCSFTSHCSQWSFRSLHRKPGLSRVTGSTLTLYPWTYFISDTC